MCAARKKSPQRRFFCCVGRCCTLSAVFCSVFPMRHARPTAMRNPTLSLLLVVGAASAGCNLFGEVEQPPTDAAGDGGVSDVGSGDVAFDLASDGAISDTGAPDSTARDASRDRGGDAETDEGISGDSGSLDADGMRCWTDAELCAQLAGDCGRIRRGPPGGFVQIEIETVGGQGSAQGPNGEYWRMNSGFDFNIPIDVVTAGDYLLSVRASGEQAPPIPVALRLSVDGTAVATFPVAEEYDVFATFSTVVPIADPGAHVVTIRFANDYYDGTLDRNMVVDWLSVEGPLGLPVDNCGVPRDVDCGACAGNEACGALQANVCGCKCPTAGGGCAAPGEDVDQCVTCGTDGPQAKTGGCADGDLCTNDACSTLGICVSTPKGCGTNTCRRGVCDPADGSCSTVPRNEGMACADDGLSCTADVCRSGSCAHEADAASCAVDAACWVDADPNPNNVCEVCDPAQSTTAWSALPDGTNCGTGGLKCSAGVCM